MIDLLKLKALFGNVLQLPKGCIMFQDCTEVGEIIQYGPGDYEGGIEGYEPSGDVFTVKTDPDSREEWPEEFAHFEDPDEAELYAALRPALPEVLAALERLRLIEQAGQIDLALNAREKALIDSVIEAIEGYAVVEWRGRERDNMLGLLRRLRGPDTEPLTQADYRLSNPCVNYKKKGQLF